MEINDSIFVKNLRGRTISILNALQLTTEELKERIFEKEGIPGNQQLLIFSGKQLEDGRLLKDYGIANEKLVHLVLRLRGGGEYGFHFNGLNEKKLGKLTKDGPDYRQIRRGLNLTATCASPQCVETRGQKVIIMLGMKENEKSFNIPKEIANATCPMCHVKVSDTVKNLIFYDCHYRIKGQKLINGKYTDEGKFKDEGDTPPESENNYVTFDEGPDAKWAYLKVKVTKLQNKPV